MNGIPPDDANRLNPTERLLLVELFRLGQEISSFVLRAMGAEAEQMAPISAADEFQLGSRLVELGTILQARAAERGTDGAAGDGGSEA